MTNFSKAVTGQVTTLSLTQNPPSKCWTSASAAAKAMPHCNAFGTVKAMTPHCGVKAQCGWATGAVCCGATFPTTACCVGTKKTALSAPFSQIPATPMATHVTPKAVCLPWNTTPVVCVVATMTAHGLFCATASAAKNSMPPTMQPPHLTALSTSQTLATASWAPMKATRQSLNCPHVCTASRPMARSPWRPKAPCVAPTAFASHPTSRNAMWLTQARPTVLATLPTSSFLM